MGVHWGQRKSSLGTEEKANRVLACKTLTGGKEVSDINEAEPPVGTEEKDINKANRVLPCKTLTGVKEVSSINEAEPPVGTEEKDSVIL